MSSGAGSIDAMHNDADVTFAQMMIVHHQGAIEMADLAPTRAGSQEVKDLAAQIKAAQAPEIAQMTGWLQAWGAGTNINGMPNMTASSADMGGTAGMDHGGADSAGSAASSEGSGGTQMPGMMMADQMSELTSASGTDFDRLFLQLMIVHHQGALEMAQTELDQGSDPDALKLAGSIQTSQTAEIATMQQMLQAL